LNETSIRMTLVAAKKRCRGTRKVPLKKKSPTATARQSRQSFQARLQNLRWKLPPPSNQRQLRAFAQHHQETKRKMPQPAAFPAFSRKSRLWTRFFFFRWRATRFIPYVIVTTKTAAIRSIGLQSRLR